VTSSNTSRSFFIAARIRVKENIYIKIIGKQSRPSFVLKKKITLNDQRSKEKQTKLKFKIIKLASNTETDWNQ
jgi:hypothetical protein